MSCFAITNVNSALLNIRQSARNRKLPVALSLLLVLVISSCGKTEPEAQSNAQSAKANEEQALNQISILNADSGWPRTLMTVNGLITLNEAPQRIVSTSVTITGTLLAIDAPLVGSGATSPNTNVADENGFFSQWSHVAKDKQLKSLYNSAPNAEAIAKTNPDLIIVAAAGGDSARDMVDQFSQIAPTLVIGYDDKSWQELARVLGDFIGREQQTDDIIETFNQQVTSVKTSITLPPQPTSAMVYYGDNSGANIWTAESAQGKLLMSLGFELADIPQTVKGDNSQGMRSDIVIVSGEKFAQGVTGNSVVLIAADESRIADFKGNSYLEHLPPVQNNNVFVLGDDTFRLDYYSSTNLLNRVQALFGLAH